jgi:hypothetical protein
VLASACGALSLGLGWQSQLQRHLQCWHVRQLLLCLLQQQALDGLLVVLQLLLEVRLLLLLLARRRLQAEAD